MTKNRRDPYLGAICAAVVVVLVAATAGAQTLPILTQRPEALATQTTPVQTPVETLTAPAAPSEPSPATVAPATTSQEPLEVPALSSEAAEDYVEAPGAPAAAVEVPEEAVEGPREASPRPDRALTPGRVRTTDLEDICTNSTKLVRHTTRGTKREVMRAYGKLDVPGYVADHLIPLEDGGADVVENLWAQPIDQSRAKDRCEGRAHRLVCAGKLDLTASQRGFAEDFGAFCRSIGVPIR